MSYTLTCPLAVCAGKKEGGKSSSHPQSGNLLTTTQTSHDPQDLWIMIHLKKKEVIYALHTTLLLLFPAV